MTMRTKLSLAISLASALTISDAAMGDDANAAAEDARYDFMLGVWELEAATMQPDQSLMPGTGVMTVYPVHEGQSLQADMQVEFEDGTGFIGTTMRTYDYANGNWAVSWIPAGAQAAAGAVANWQDDRMVEIWPAGEDRMGAFENTLTVSEITEDRFVVSADRHYVNGPTIEGVWRYVATRRSDDEMAH
ncbi:MAG: DUF1579 domain-containing protein [Alphaproteobacteria bacterium]|nr:DUF1579 domain-containing protein [Alphaproteobacteria bacterium]